MKLLNKLLLSALCALFASASLADVIKTVQAGAVDQTVTLRIIDSTDGTPETGVVFNTSGIDLSYWRHGANSVVAITEATQTVNGAHSDGGFVHLGNGVYRLDLPDAAVAAGATAVDVFGTVTGMIVLGGTVELSPPVNTVALAGTAQTARDIGASVLISSGTGTGQLSVTSGVIASNVTQFGGVAGTFASGRPEVNTSHIAGSAVSTSTAQIGVNVVNAGGTAWGSGAITAASIATDAIGAAEIAADAIGASEVAANAIAEDAFDTTAGSFKPLGILDQGTAQAATATTVQLRSAAAFGDDTLLGATIVACGSTQGYCQSGIITDYVSATDTATVATWGVTPSGTVTYYVFGTAPGSGSGASAADVWAYATRTLTALDEDSTTIDLNASAVGSVAGAVGSVGTGGITAASFGAGAIDAAAIAADAIGASEIATDAIGAAEIAASAIGSSEIADGGITSAEFGTGAITATVVAADAIGASELAADAATEVASATLTAAETTPIAADAQEINGTTVLGTGTALDKWRGP